MTINLDLIGATRYRRLVNSRLYNLRQTVSAVPVFTQVETWLAKTTQDRAPQKFPQFESSDPSIKRILKLSDFLVPKLANAQTFRFSSSEDS